MLGTSLLGNILTGKRVKAKISGKQQQEQEKELSEQGKIFNAASFFN